MPMPALWPLAMAVSMAGSPAALHSIPGGIPSAHAPQIWGATVLETLDNNPRLEPIRAEDVAGAPNVSMGASHATAMAPTRAKLEAMYATPAQSLVPFIRREVSHVWRLSVPSSVRAPSSHVTAAIESLRGEAGKLTLVGHDEISIPVVLLESTPSQHVDGAGTRVLEGGVVLQIPSSALLHSGQYGGRLILRTEGY